MRHLKSLALATLPAILCLSVHAADAGAQTRRRSFGNDAVSRVDTTVAFDRNGSITVNGASGDVIVTGWSRDQVHVRAVSEENNIRLTVSNNRMTLDVNADRGSDTRLEISVPYGARVLATTWSGDISVRGTRGQVEAHSQSGDVVVADVAQRLDVNTLSGNLTASNLSGDAEINSVAGDIRLTDVRGSVDVGTVSGDVEMRGITGKMVRAKTTSGDVTYDGGIDPAGRYEMTAHSGDIHMHIPRDASAQLTISTWNGAVNSDFPITLKPGEHGIGRSNAKRFTFEIGGAAARISAETFSGDITISSNGRGAGQRP